MGASLRRIAVTVGLASTAGLATLVVARPAAADDDTDRSIAQQLFDDGRALLDAGRYAEACPKFAESQRLDPGGGTLLNLALCHEREGKTATAWAEFREALGQAVRDERKDREDFAREHVEGLAPRLVRLIVRVPAALAAKNPEVTLDRSRVPAAAWETPIPVDPGDHVVAVVAKDASTWSMNVTANEPGRTYTVDLAYEAPLACQNGEIRVNDACVASSWREGAPHRTTAFWALLGGAGALVATSVVTGIVALDANAYVHDNCSSQRDFCRVADAGDAATRARTFAWISTATLALGGAAAGVAFLLPRSQGPAGPHGRATVTVGFGALRVTGL